MISRFFIILSTRRRIANMYSRTVHNESRGFLVPFRQYPDVSLYDTHVHVPDFTMDLMRTSGFLAYNTTATSHTIFNRHVKATKTGSH